MTSVAFKIPMFEKRQPKFGGLTASQLRARLDTAMIQRDMSGLREISHSSVRKKFANTTVGPFTVFCPTICGQDREQVKERVHQVLSTARPSPRFSVVFADPLHPREIRVALSGDSVKFFV